MISDWELKVRLREASGQWRKELRTDYIDGIIRGLAISLDLTVQLRKETYLRELSEKKLVKKVHITKKEYRKTKAGNVDQSLDDFFDSSSH